MAKIPKTYLLTETALNAIKDSSNIALRTALMNAFYKSSPTILRWANASNPKLLTEQGIAIIMANTSLSREEILVKAAE